MNGIEMLEGFGSWKLERISNTTFPRDITVKLEYLTEGQASNVADMIKNGVCYRCRIAKGRFFFGTTAEEAVRLAVASAKRKAKK